MKMPGSIWPADSGDIVLTSGRKRIELKVINRGTWADYVSHSRFDTIRPSIFRIKIFHRSALVSTSWKQTLTWTSTGKGHTAITRYTSRGICSF